MAQPELNPAYKPLERGLKRLVILSNEKSFGMSCKLPLIFTQTLNYKNVSGNIFISIGTKRHLVKFENSKIGV